MGFNSSDPWIEVQSTLPRDKQGEGRGDCTWRLWHTRAVIRALIVCQSLSVSFALSSQFRLVSHSNQCLLFSLALILTRLTCLMALQEFPAAVHCWRQDCFVCLSVRLQTHSVSVLATSVYRPRTTELMHIDKYDSVILCYLLAFGHLVMLNYM